MDNYFDVLLEEQSFFSTPEGLKKLLALVPDETLKSQVEKGLEKTPESSVDRFKTFINIYDSYIREVSLEFF